MIRRPISCRRAGGWWILFALVPFPAGAAATAHSVDPASGVESWSTRADGTAVRLTQILPDQVRAFYTARGFDAASSEHLATHYCVFQTVVRNEAASAPIRVDLSDWRAEQGHHQGGPTLLREWLPEWERRGVVAGARLAFRWAQFPNEHVYHRGDWNMGMTTYRLAPGSRFNLRLVWWQGANRKEAMLKGVRCAHEATVPRGSDRP